MNHIEDSLAIAEYEVINQDYDYKKSINDIVDFLFNEIDIVKNSTYEKIHFVAHSLGALVTRVLLNRYNIKNLGNVVQTAPPNNGSEITNCFKNNFIYQNLCGLSGQELVTGNKRLEDDMGSPKYSLGIISGNQSGLISRLFFKSENDGRVTVKSTKIREVEQHIIIKDTHNGLLKNKSVLNEIRFFLENGHFNILQKPPT